MYRGRKSGRQGYKEQVSQRALSTGNGRESTVSCRLWPADPQDTGRGAGLCAQGVGEEGLQRQMGEDERRTDTVKCRQQPAG